MSPRCVLQVAGSNHGPSSRNEDERGRLDVAAFRRLETSRGKTPYQSLGRSERLFGEILERNHDLVLFFLGDSFGFPIPAVLRRLLIVSAESGQPLILFLCVLKNRYCLNLLDYLALLVSSNRG